MTSKSISLKGWIKECHLVTPRISKRLPSIEEIKFNPYDSFEKEQWCVAIEPEPDVNGRLEHIFYDITSAFIENGLYTSNGYAEYEGDNELVEFYTMYKPKLTGSIAQASTDEELTHQFVEVLGYPKVLENEKTLLSFHLVNPYPEPYAYPFY